MGKLIDLTDLSRFLDKCKGLFAKKSEAYKKPNSGIPKTDLAHAVQTSLGKADTAYQKPGSGIPKTDLASEVQTSLGKADTAYKKPNSGIPKTDLASAVQTSLGKADTAYQKPSSGIPASDLAFTVDSVEYITYGTQNVPSISEGKLYITSKYFDSDNILNHHILTHYEYNPITEGRKLIFTSLYGQKSRTITATKANYGASWVWSSEDEVTLPTISGANNIVVLTQSQYDNLPSYDNNTLYFIK